MFTEVFSRKNFPLYGTITCSVALTDQVMLTRKSELLFHSQMEEIDDKYVSSTMNMVPDSLDYMYYGYSSPKFIAKLYFFIHLVLYRPTRLLQAVHFSQELQQTLDSCQESIRQLSAANHELMSNQQHLVDTNQLTTKHQRSAQIAYVLLASCLLPALAKIQQLTAQQHYAMREVRTISSLEEEARLVIQDVDNVLDCDGDKREEGSCEQFHPLLRFRQVVIAVLAACRLRRTLTITAHTQLRIHDRLGRQLLVHLPSNGTSTQSCFTSWFLDDQLAASISECTSDILSLVEPCELSKASCSKVEKMDLLSAVERSCDMLLLRCGHLLYSNGYSGMPGDSDGHRPLCSRLGDGLNRILTRQSRSPYRLYTKVYTDMVYMYICCSWYFESRLYLRIFS